MSRHLLFKHTRTAKTYKIYKNAFYFFFIFVISFQIEKKKKNLNPRKVKHLSIHMPAVFDQLILEDLFFFFHIYNLLLKIKLNKKTQLIIIAN